MEGADAQLPSYDDVCRDVSYAASNVPLVVSIVINGDTYAIQPLGGSFRGDVIEVPAEMSLAEFIRSHTCWKGTKIACAEGGCGACTVALTYVDHTTNAATTVGANACLRPVLACGGMAVTTNDGLVGTPNTTTKDYNPIQKTLAAHNGSQCGFCSNGFVMTMYTFLAERSQRGQSVDALSIEQAFDGNLCRCTGYRPILDAMKSFASGKSTLGDIFNDVPECKKSNCCQRKKQFNLEHIPDLEEVVTYLGDDAHGEHALEGHKLTDIGTA